MRWRGALSAAPADLPLLLTWIMWNIAREARNRLLACSPRRRKRKSGSATLRAQKYRSRPIFTSSFTARRTVCNGVVERGGGRSGPPRWTRASPSTPAITY